MTPDFPELDHVLLSNLENHTEVFDEIYSLSVTADTANETTVTDSVSSPFVTNESSSERAQAVIRDNCTAAITRFSSTQTCNGYPSTIILLLRVVLLRIIVDVLLLQLVLFIVGILPCHLL